MSTSTGRRQFIPQIYMAAPPNRSRARWLRVYRFALMHKASMQTLVRQALAQIGNAALMTPGRYISQRVRHTLR